LTYLVNDRLFYLCYKKTTFKLTSTAKIVVLHGDTNPKIHKICQKWHNFFCNPTAVRQINIFLRKEDVSISWLLGCWLKSNRVIQFEKIFHHMFSCRHWIASDVHEYSSVVFVYFPLKWGSSWSLSYGSWIYNFLCNQCISSLTYAVTGFLRVLRFLHQ
jgi:hypothetical protein